MIIILRRRIQTKSKNLYTIVFETEKEVITDRVGIREIHIENRVVYFNGKR